MLAQKGISVTVLEKGQEIDRNPRASFYNAPTLYELRRAGLMEDIMKNAFVPDGVSWRVLEVDGEKKFEKVCTLLADNPPGQETHVSLPLDELLPLMADHLARHPTAQVLLSHEVLSLGQDRDKAWVNVKTPEGEKRLEADYIVGCDGAPSKVRHELFGNEFPGFTWDKQIVATNVNHSKNRDYHGITDAVEGVLPQIQGLQLDIFNIHDPSGALPNDRPASQRRPLTHHLR